ncbi:hypothetical protein [Leptolyngbya sp. KIOST-1]|uniref:hypothetical protein n=1 Tax=Leptolyngbya sp. KIOST-1 TaxID=1229172 RepID=UPI00056A307C|nr:hypothetical protein [Leptolyngbya sp. KIOST-1]
MKEPSATEPPATEPSATKSSHRWFASLRRLPLGLVLCVALLGVWALSLPGPSHVVCDRAASGQVYCQASHPQPWGWLARPQPLTLQDIAISSELCDKTPRGGVRFCHRLTLLGSNRQIVLPEVRSPLSAAALGDRLHGFMAGEGSPQLSWSGDRSALPWRTPTIALLLTVGTWALWDVRWPPVPTSPLALDGATDSLRSSNNTKD